MVLLVTVTEYSSNAAAVGVVSRRGVAGDGAVGHRHRTSSNAAAVGAVPNRVIAGDGAVGHRHRIGEDAAASGLGDRVELPEMVLLVTVTEPWAYMPPPLALPPLLPTA